MTKVEPSIINNKHLGNVGTNLDTLVQLRTATDNQVGTKGGNQRLSLQKKARSKQRNEKCNADYKSERTKKKQTL